MQALCDLVMVEAVYANWLDRQAGGLYVAIHGTDPDTLARRDFIKRMRHLLAED